MRSSKNAKPKMVVLASQMVTPTLGSGGERVFMELVKRWKEFDITVVVPPGVEEVVRKEFDSSIKINSLCSVLIKRMVTSSKTCSFFDFLILFIGAFKVYSKLKELSPDIIYCTGDFFSNTIPAAVYKNFFQEKIIFIRIHHVIEHFFSRKGNSLLRNIASYILQKISFKFIKWNMDHIFLLNQEVHAQLLDSGFSKERISIIGNGVNYHEILQRYAPFPEEYDICWFARLDPSKGCYDLPEVIRVVRNEYPGIKAAVIGNSNTRWRPKVDTLVKKYNLEDNIYFLGFLPYDKIFPILKSSKCFISCSYEEGWGITICEALACGIPAILYDLPVYREIFHDGIITVPIGNTDQFAKKILYLLKNEQERMELGKRGQKDMRKYDWEYVAKKELNTIMKVIKQ